MKSEHETALDQVVEQIDRTMQVKERRQKALFHKDCQKYFKELFAYRGKKLSGIVLATLLPKSVISLTLLRFVRGITTHNLHKDYNINFSRFENKIVYVIVHRKTALKFELRGTSK